MTQAEKMVVEFDWESCEETLNLIHQVAERTREECVKAYYDCPAEEDPDLAIRDAKWEDEEV